MAAKVGEVSIPASLVADVASAQRVEPRRAALLLADDALAAKGATERELDRAQPFVWQLTSARARFVVDRVRAEVAKVPPSEAEIDDLAKKHWRDIDRPEGVRIIHAVALVPTDSKSGRERAHGVAETIEKAVAGASDADDFERLAKSVAHDGDLDVRVERFAFVADGRAIDDDSRFDQKFVAGALSIPEVGLTSRPVESEWGWHVIRLLEKLPPRRVPREQLRVLFHDEILTLRARRALDARLAELKKRTAVEISNAATTLMESVPVSP
jgi:peptidyl-prolyl cis-trans isomerase C